MVEKENQTQTLMVECSNCKQNYNFIGTVKRLICYPVDVEKEEQEHLLLSYSICPHCGHIHLSQLDNDITKPIMKESSRLLRKKILFDSKGREMKRKDKRKMLELSKELNGLRLMLKAQYQGEKLAKVYADKNLEIKETFIFEYSEPKLLIQNKQQC